MLPLLAAVCAGAQTPAKAPATSQAPASQTQAQSAASNVNVPVRTQQIMAHLSSVIRYYRAAMTPSQKVGEPSDVLFQEQATADARQALDYAFQFGKAEGSLLNAYQKKNAVTQVAAETQLERLQRLIATTSQRIAALKQQQEQLQSQIAVAKAKQLPALRSENQTLEGQLALNNAMVDALGKIVDMSQAQGQAGFAGDVERLRRTAPDLSKSGTPTPTLENFAQAESSGVSSQAIVFFQLLASRQSIDTMVQQNKGLQAQALELRTPLVKIMHAMVEQGQVDASQPTADGTTAPLPPQNIDALVAQFKAISAASVPLSQEVITLQQGQANLLAWRSAVETEYKTVLHHLLLHVLVIVAAVGLLLAFGEGWKRLTVRYVRDVRRRRQLLGMRRLVVGFLCGLVVLLGFVTKFNSLATFAGFITAGLAVGLQTILLSVAAYFFIVGRYGVKVGDRITVNGVTGDVIEVGLVRFYVMELGGSSTSLQPTGRVAVLSNAILFQAGTPLYKQLPGTAYAWHELTTSLQATADYQRAADTILKLVQTVYDEYRASIEQQQRSVELWMDSRIAAPVVDSKLQYVDGGLQLMVRFPVEIRDASEIDQKVTATILAMLREDAALQQAVTGQPVIRAAVKG